MAVRVKKQRLLVMETNSESRTKGEADGGIVPVSFLLEADQNMHLCFFISVCGSTKRLSYTLDLHTFYTLQLQEE